MDPQEREAIELRMLYQISVEDIRYAKRLQWAIPNYVLILLAVTVAFYEKLNSASCFWRYSLVALDLLIVSLGSYYLLELQQRLVEYRQRIVMIGNSFSQTVRDSLDLDDHSYTSYMRNFYSFVLPFILLQWVGWFFVLWLFFFSTK